MWVRGLKLVVLIRQIDVGNVAPHVGAWIETKVARKKKASIESHPMWVRGLKLASGHRGTCSRMSHPMWVRGLKPVSHDGQAKVRPVAPHVGAWIETRPSSDITSDFLGRTPCGCVD